MKFKFWPHQTDKVTNQRTTSLFNQRYLTLGQKDMSSGALTMQVACPDIATLYTYWERHAILVIHTAHGWRRSDVTAVSAIWDIRCRRKIKLWSSGLRHIVFWWVVYQNLSVPPWNRNWNVKQPKHYTTVSTTVRHLSLARPQINPAYLIPFLERAL